MDQATFLRSLLRVIGEVGTDPLSRDQLRTSSGIEEPELGELLEEAVDLGFLTGTEVAEERGPVQAISLTTAGRRTAETVYVDAQTYLGYRITAQPIGTRGSSSGEIFEAERGGELAMRLEFSVTYTAAAGGHQRPDQMAFEMGQSYFRGLLLLGDVERGSTTSLTVDSTNLSATNQMADDDIESAVLQALSEMLTAEAHSNEVPYLDVDGLALVLGVEASRVSEALSRMEVMGDVQSHAATFGRPMNQGACRITEAGLRKFRDVSDRRRTRRNVGTGDTSALESAESGSRPRVFVSYSHDSNLHDDEVLDLATRLREMGIEVELDRYEPHPVSGWPRWMEEMIEWADFVLVVCTEAYRRRVMGRETSGMGLGATYEGTLISQQTFEAGGQNEKFIPIVLRRSDLTYRPEWLRTYTYYNVSDESGSSALYRRLTSQPAVVRPDLGPLVAMPPIEAEQRDTDVDGDIHATDQTDDLWHLDLCFLWEANERRSRYLISWSPSESFFTSDDTAATLESMGGVLTPSDLAIESGISVGFLPGRSLHVEFSSPAHKVGGRLHTPDSRIEPDSQGGGAREYLSWNLERHPELP
jgi:hypothetical protein